MDSAITLPILGKVGLDAVLGLVPVVGDLAGLVVAFFTNSAKSASFSAAAAGFVGPTLGRGDRVPTRKCPNGQGEEEEKTKDCFYMTEGNHFLNPSYSVTYRLCRGHYRSGSPSKLGKRH